MRKSHVLAVVVASLVSAASFAGAQAPAPGATAPRQAMKHQGDGVRGMRGGALRGLTLSDAEQAKVKEIRERQKAELAAMRTSMQPVMDEARALRQKGDTAGLRALHERNKGRHEQMQALQAKYQSEIRAALTPANQAKFDANVQAQAKRRAEWAGKGKDGHHGGKRGWPRGVGREG